MGWNGSGNKNAAPVSKKAVKTPPSKGRGLIALAIVVALGCAAIWWFVGRGGDNQLPTANKQTTTRTIAEVKPQIPTNRPAKVEAEEPEKPKELPPQRVGEIRNGYRLLPSGRLHRVLGEIVVNGDDDTLMGKVFKCTTDRKMMELVTLEPGEYVLPDENEGYFRNFDQQFRESLKEEIVIKPDDSEYVRQLKESAKELRTELKARMDRGESLEAVMTDTRKQLQELSLYREDITKQIREMTKDGEFDEKDYQDLVDAANLMLEERGCKKLELPAALREQVSIEQAKEKGEEE